MKKQRLLLDFLPEKIVRNLHNWLYNVEFLVDTQPVSDLQAGGLIVSAKSKIRQ